MDKGPGLGLSTVLNLVKEHGGFLVVSGRLDEMTKEEYKNLGVTLHLAKPFTKAQLAEALKTLLALK